MKKEKDQDGTNLNHMSCADDLVVMSENGERLQQILAILAPALTTIGLVMNNGKIKIHLLYSLSNLRYMIDEKILNLMVSRVNPSFPFVFCVK